MSQRVDERWVVLRPQPGCVSVDDVERMSADIERLAHAFRMSYGCSRDFAWRQIASWNGVLTDRRHKPQA